MIKQRGEYAQQIYVSSEFKIGVGVEFNAAVMCIGVGWNNEWLLLFNNWWLWLWWWSMDVLLFDDSFIVIIIVVWFPFKIDISIWQWWWLLLLWWWCIGGDDDVDVVDDDDGDDVINIECPFDNWWLWLWWLSNGQHWSIVVGWPISWYLRFNDDDNGDDESNLMM